MERREVLSAGRPVAHTCEVPPCGSVWLQQTHLLALTHTLSQPHQELPGHSVLVFSVTVLLPGWVDRVTHPGEKWLNYQRSAVRVNLTTGC